MLLKVCERIRIDRGLDFNFNPFTENIFFFFPSCFLLVLFILSSLLDLASWTFCIASACYSGSPNLCVSPSGACMACLNSFIRFCCNDFYYLLTQFWKLFSNCSRCREERRIVFCRGKKTFHFGPNFTIPHITWMVKGTHLEVLFWNHIHHFNTLLWSI